MPLVWHDRDAKVAMWHDVVQRVRPAAGKDDGRTAAVFARRDHRPRRRGGRGTRGGGGGRGRCWGAPAVALASGEAVATAVPACHADARAGAAAVGRRHDRSLLAAHAQRAKLPHDAQPHDADDAWHDSVSPDGRLPVPAVPARHAAQHAARHAACAAPRLRRSTADAAGRDGACRRDAKAGAAAGGRDGTSCRDARTGDKTAGGNGASAGTGSDASCDASAAAHTGGSARPGLPGGDGGAGGGAWLLWGCGSTA
mmetsp:Transcript_5393/g.17857  ORF Transcript_5393/g.17857 Transcript_5393/m.17857 type:complete len:255 (-) Transcript_5393:209-973(-)